MSAPKTRVEYIGGRHPYQARYFDDTYRLWFDIGDSKATIDEAKANEREFHANRVGDAGPFDTERGKHELGGA